jgi:hypothetical protein
VYSFGILLSRSHNPLLFLSLLLSLSEIFSSQPRLFFLCGTFPVSRGIIARRLLGLMAALLVKYIFV